MITIDLIYFNAGGGHRAAALALEAVIAGQRRPWTVRLVDLFDVVDPHGQFERVTGMAPEAYYNKRLAKGWTLGLAQELKLLQAMIRLGHAKLSRILQRHWLKTEPDLVVSLVPNFNRALCESVGAVLPGVPFVTVMTDLADHPPSFWIEPDLPQHVVCGTRRAVLQAIAAGCASERIHATSGMIVRPDFYRAPPVDRRAERLALGLDPERPVGLVLFGGHGSVHMRSIARRLPDVQLILMCGHNEALATQLRAMAAARTTDAASSAATPAARVVVGFTADVRRYMALGDFFIGKPGPGSLSEALQQGLPVITVRNAWTMPQERYNTEWIVEHGLGLVGPSMHRIAPVVQALLAGLSTFRAAVARLDNRAVFEVPDLIAKILDETAMPASRWPSTTTG